VHVRVRARSFFLFAAFYFTKLFNFRLAQLHEEFYEGFQGLATGAIKEAAWIAYRESAKTSIAKIGLSWLIARKQVSDALRDNGDDVSGWGERLYINVGSYDKANAESILFDVVTKLQGNDLLIAGFGHLYNQPRTKDPAQLKRIEFGRGIRVEAHTAHSSRCAVAYTNSSGRTSFCDDLQKAITAEHPPVVARDRENHQVSERRRVGSPLTARRSRVLIGDNGHRVADIYNVLTNANALATSKIQRNCPETRGAAARMASGNAIFRVARCTSTRGGWRYRTTMGMNILAAELNKASVQGRCSLTDLLPQTVSLPARWHAFPTALLKPCDVEFVLLQPEIEPLHGFAEFDGG
jgi:hypothetical protein